MTVHVPPSRARLVALSLALALLAIPAGTAAAADESGYWAFAARRAADIERSWSDSRGVFAAREQGVNSRLNANMLALYALAAVQRRPPGPERRDDRARRLVDRFVSAPAFVGGKPPQAREGQPHTPGWDGGVERVLGRQHVSLDPQVASALALAHAARGALGLTDGQAAMIRDRIGRVARSRFFRYPALALNQINWPATMYAADYAVTGRTDLLRDDFRRQLVRFVGAARAYASGNESAATNLTSGLGLRYLPRHSPSSPANRTSTSEYGNIIFSGLEHYETALAAGMRPLGPRQMVLLRAWARRVLYGEWTHSGYLNWDTGLGSNRWHLQRYWPFALAGPLALAASPRFAGPELRARAAWIIDRALQLYEQRTRAYPRSLLPSRLFGLRGHDGSKANDPELIASRFALVAATAAARGLGAAPKAAPPPFYALDADIRRVAISTPAYSTALIQPQPGLGYGGLEPARLLGADGDPLTGIGGSRASALGLSVRTPAGVRLDTQPGQRWPRRARVLPWRIDHRDPRGAFSALVAQASVQRGQIAIRVAHRFLPDRVETGWSITAPGGSVVRLAFPIWSPRPERTRACMAAKAGECRRIAPRAQRLGGRAIRIGAQRGGYAATVTGAVGALVRLTRPGIARSSPFTRRTIVMTVRVPRAGRLALRRTVVPVTP